MAFSLRLSEVANKLGGELMGADAEFNSISIDTRTMKAGDLFVALKGGDHDGSEYLDSATTKGAVAAIVAENVESELSKGELPEAELPRVVVKDTRVALGQLAALWRSNFSIPVVGITGSNGKTTVKEMVASILGQCASVTATEGNFNNELGVPLSIFHINEQHEVAVIEMGANHPGEIAYLSSLTRPTIALITNAAPAHLKGFGDISGVVKAKGEIFSSMGPEGTAILNADDEHLDEWRDMIKGPSIVTFGFAVDADFRAECPGSDGVMGGVTGSVFTLITPAGDIAVNLALPGRHNVLNALAASAVAQCFGVSLETIKTGLEKMQPVKGRMQAKLRADGIRVMDDTYNANPASLEAALNVLASSEGVSVLVLGDMCELGDDGYLYHQKAGLLAKKYNIDYFYATGDLGRAAAEAYGDAAKFFDDNNDLIVALCDDLQAMKKQKTIVLVKGSRSMGMEKVVEALLSDSALSVSAGKERVH